MNPPDLFDIPHPHAPTSTQNEAINRLGPKIWSIRNAVLAFVDKRRRFGATPREIAVQLSYDVVTVRARLTEHHQRGLLIRTEQIRDEQHVYVCPSFWEVTMGSVPSKRHKGQT